MKIPVKQAFQEHLQRRFSLRLHMFIILLSTTLSGILFSKILLIFGVVDFRIRYPLCVLFSYLIFFICIRLWLHCISPSRPGRSGVFDWLDLPTFRGLGRGGASTIRGGGGQFFGAGASASFEGQDTAITETALFTTSQTTPAGSAPEGIGEVVGDAVSSLGDDHIILALIVLAVLVATILASTLYVLYGAPAILSEAAFEGILAASLIKRTRAISDTAWVGSIFKTTWKAFAVTVGVTFISGIVLHAYFPEAVKLADILWKN